MKEMLTRAYACLEGKGVPPRIMQLVDAIQAEAEELQRMKAD